MLTISESRANLSRRDLLRIGSLGLGAVALPQLLTQAASAGQFSRSITGRSVVFLFQQGGPSQLETFDPKPEAPSGIRTATGTIQTAIPGVGFGSAMNRLAKHADKLTVVRSFQTGNAGHNIEPVVGKYSHERNIGTHISRIVGATRPDSGMPTNAVLFPQAVDSAVTKGSARGDLTESGSYGSAYKPFVPGGKGQLQKDMQLNLPHERVFDERRKILEQLDRLNRNADAFGLLKSTDEVRQQAYQVLLGGGVSKALDLSREDPAVLQKYDTSQFVRSHDWSKVRRGKSGYYTGQAKTIGKLLLLARRLCEAGCGFITVHAGYAGVWDMHADGNNLNMVDGMEAIGPAFDHAVSAFIEDIEARGLQDKILLVACGEMGRTPRINKRGGRDHWSRLAPLLLYGGGTKGGQVIGQSDTQGSEPNSDPFTSANLISTILHTVFDIAELRLVPSVPTEITQLSSVEPIPVW